MFMELGGDLFGYYDLDEDYFVIYLIDVCGYGVGVVFLLVFIINVLRFCVLLDIDFRLFFEVLYRLNNVFLMEW